MLTSSHPVALPATFGSLAEQFISHCEARRLSPKTVRKYRDNLAKLGPGDQTTISRTNVETAMARFKDHSAQSVTSYLRTWKTFFTWLSSTYGLVNLAEGLKGPRVPRRDRRTFTQGELAKIWAAGASIRDRVFLLLALDTGARFGEIARLRRQDVGPGYVVLNASTPNSTPCEHCETERAAVADGGKSGERVVPISQQTQVLLDRVGDDLHVWTREPYPKLKLSRNELILQLHRKGIGYLTIAKTLPRFGFQRISDNGVRRIIKHHGDYRRDRTPVASGGLETAWKRMIQRAGIARHKAGPHTLRHTFATEFLRRGGALEILQQILGHSDVSTTIIYVHLNRDDVATSHRRAGVVSALLPNAAQNSQRLRTMPNRQRRQKVREAGGNRCVRCGGPANTVDHVLPLALGGTHSRLNLQPMCELCNTAKADHLEPGMWDRVPALNGALPVEDLPQLAR